jgi:hypothetical protein
MAQSAIARMGCLARVTVGDLRPPARMTVWDESFWLAHTACRP